MHPLVIRATLVWVGLFIVAFLNGALRELGLKAYFGIADPAAHQLSCLTGVALWTGFTLLFWKKLGIQNRRQALAVGFGWFLATVLVETFVLNRNLSWTEILETYNLGRGELWGLVVLWIGVMPILIYYFNSPDSSRTRKSG